MPLNIDHARNRPFTIIIVIALAFAGAHETVKIWLPKCLESGSPV
jgi:hypothetical protein